MVQSIGEKISAAAETTAEAGQTGVGQGLATSMESDPAASADLIRPVYLVADGADERGNFLWSPAFATPGRQVGGQRCTIITHV